MLMQAPPTVVANQQVKLLSGATYTVDANLFVNAASYQDFVNLLDMGFFPAWGGRNNFTATTDPGSSNDSSQDYALGSLWKNGAVSPARWWGLENATIASAVWDQISVGVNASNAGSAQFINLVLTALLTESTATVTPFNGGGQSSATSMTAMVNNITSSVASSAPYDSVKFGGTTNGMQQSVYNNSANPIQLFGSGSITVNGFGSTTGVTIPAGGFYAGKLVNGNWQAIVPGMGFTTNQSYGTNTATSSATLTGANVTGGINMVTLNLTGTLGAGANATLPTVTNLLAAIPNPVTGYTYRLRIMNTSSANFTWTVVTNTGWTLNGTMTIAQNTWREFDVTLGASTATLQDVRGGNIV